MGRILNFLFQKTVDGATYLQTILMLGLLFVGIFYLFKTIKEVIDDYKDGKHND